MRPAANIRRQILGAGRDAAAAALPLLGGHVRDRRPAQYAARPGRQRRSSHRPRLGLVPIARRRGEGAGRLPDLGLSRRPRALPPGEGQDRRLFRRGGAAGRGRPRAIAGPGADPQAERPLGELCGARRRRQAPPDRDRPGRRGGGPGPRADERRPDLHVRLRRRRDRPTRPPGQRGEDALRLHPARVLRRQRPAGPLPRLLVGPEAPPAQAGRSATSSPNPTRSSATGSA